ncbi:MULTISPECIES: zinc-binding dehydrogenase [Streptomyces]|uniref:Zinc-binding dehydrogenase n=1 Tax=Streptomyces lycii TaxID=2654337 RepID=A0ABQ7FHE7_9ACTN|nr:MULTISPECIES: zinc-binding dehydrogenase [Streptomyces]KAF4406673.1 zinc-binding dehydrogenase [Streptomyces lycii]PGH46698.1 oxidoreductase [Streptomyces sp. Ru87]
MLAIRQYAFGPAENLIPEKVPDPEPGPGQVRVAVAAAGVHLLDTAIRAGAHGGPFPLPELPMTPGREVAGTVEAVGTEADASWAGRRVVVHLGPASGGYAEKALASAESLHPLPDGLTPEQAVAMIGTGRTAMGILETAAITPDDVVAITGAAGGLGTLLVQEARRLGATVIGLAGGPAKTDAVLTNGAHIAVDYTVGGWRERVREALGGRAVTLVLAGVGGEPGRGAFELLAPGGRQIVYGWQPDSPLYPTDEELAERGVTSLPAIGPRLLNRPGGLRPLETAALEAAATGRLVPAVQAFPLTEAAAAHRALEGRVTRGKVVLVP